MSRLRISGGTVYDPANGIDGVVRDLYIEDGRIVAAPGDGRRASRTIDATGLLVFPGGVDAHTHVAGAALSLARRLTPEHFRRAAWYPAGPGRRAGLGGVTPTTFATGYLYAGMGWTTVNEAAVPVLSVRHTHEELHDTPILDTSLLVLMANNEILLDLLEEGEIARARDVVAWLVASAGAWGVKAVNPGGVVDWKWGKNAAALTEPVSGYRRVTPATIIGALAAIVDELGLPHPMHLHCPNLGVPGNAEATVETMRLLEGRRAHLAHLQYHAYGGEDWAGLRSASTRVAEAFNARRDLTADAGAVLFGDAVTISADGPRQHLLHALTGRKWVNVDVENETGCGIVPYSYAEHNVVNAVQWAVGLELMLLVEDPWRMFLTTDHPNGAAFWRYPEIAQLLMDAEYRRACLKRLPADALARIVLADLDREYTLSEMAVVTSAGPARALGLSRKGHLGAGADADLALYPARPDGDGRLFEYPRYVIKGGVVVVEEGELRAVSEGRQFVIQPSFDRGVEAYLRPRFQELYTVSFENYPVELEHLPHAEIQRV